MAYDQHSRGIPPGPVAGLPWVKRDTSGLKAGWDDTEQVPWFRYRAGGVTHEVWYEDVQSFQAKLTLVGTYGLQGFSAWMIGQEDPQIWKVLSQKVQVRRFFPFIRNR